MQNAFSDYASERFSSLLLLAARGLTRHQAQRDIRRGVAVEVDNPFSQMFHSNSSLHHTTKHFRLKETRLMSRKK